MSVMTQSDVAFEVDRVVHQSDAAILVMPTETQTSTWLPKSQVRNLEEIDTNPEYDGPKFEVIIPAWLAKKAGVL